MDGHTPPLYPTLVDPAKDSNFCHKGVLKTVERSRCVSNYAGQLEIAETGELVDVDVTIVAPAWVHTSSWAFKTQTASNEQEFESSPGFGRMMICGLVAFSARLNVFVEAGVAVIQMPHALTATPLHWFCGSAGAVIDIFQTEC